MECGVLVPQPGIKPAPPALEAWSFSHWTGREIPGLGFLHMVLFNPPNFPSPEALVRLCRFLGTGRPRGTLRLTTLHCPWAGLPKKWPRAVFMKSQCGPSGEKGEMLDSRRRGAVWGEGQLCRFRLHPPLSLPARGHSPASGVPAGQGRRQDGKSVGTLLLVLISPLALRTTQAGNKNCKA